MRGIERLIEGLQRGDEQAMAVLIFTVAGTLVIVAATEVIQRRRRARRASGRSSALTSPAPPEFQ